MIVSLVQFAPKRHDVSSNLAAMRRALPDAADLIVYPELATTGYLFETREELEAVAEDAEGPTSRALVELAKERNAHLVYGFVEKSGSGMYNSAALIGPKGVVDVYRKVHLFDLETRVFDAGKDGWRVNEIAGAKVGMMICFDWIFPEAARSLALRGADILCHPSNLVLPYCQEAMITRCLENRVFAATCNRVGTESAGEIRLTFTGKSQIVSPGGKRLAAADEIGTETISVALDPHEARDKRQTPRNDLFRQRTPELYGILTEKGEK